MSSRIYVGRLPHGTHDRDIERFFKGFGRIREILLKDGYGFVEFDDHRDADDAVYELNGREMKGERIQIEIARGRPRGQDMWRDRDRGYGGRSGGGRRGGGGGRDKYGPPTRTEYRLIVENLSSRVSWQDLKDYMRQAGEVTYADAHKQVRNEGIVEFASYSGMRNALEKMDDTEINGKRIKLSEDKPKRRSSRRSRSRSRGRHSRSHSRSRSRSRSRRRSRSGSRRRHSRSGSRRRHSRSGSRSRSRSRSHGRDRSRDKSMSRSRSRSRDKSRSPRKRSHSRSGSRSRSRSASPDKNNHAKGESDRGSDKE